MQLTAGVVLAIYNAGGTFLFRHVVHFYSAVHKKKLKYVKDEGVDTMYLIEKKP